MRRLLAPTLGLLGLGLVAAGGAAWAQELANRERAAAEFELLSEDATRRLLERIRLYEYGLRGARGSVLAAGEHGVRRSIFRAYHGSREVDSEFPGARGFGFIRRVRRDDEAAFVAAARADGAPDFTIKELAPHGDERFVIQYIEPVERNEEAVGLDIGSEAKRREAAALALRTGEVAITRPITLVQVPGKVSHGFLILLPIYRPDRPLATELDRERAAFGWAYAPLVIDEVLASFDARGGLFTIALSDVGNGGAPERFYGAPAAAEGALVRRIERPIFGRPWSIEVRSEPAFIARLGLLPPRVVFAAGALTATLLAAFLYAFLLGRSRKRQIGADQARLATIVENSSDAIVAEDLDGVITSWNRAAERIFGHSAAAAIGRRSADLIGPLDPADGAAVASARIGRTVHPFDLICRRRDGSTVEVSITVSPITAPDGQIVGVGKTIRNISERKRAERQLQEFNAALEREVGERTAQLQQASHDLRTIVDALPSLVGYWDRNLINRFANAAYRQWFGVDGASLAGRSLRDLLGDALFERNRPHYEAALRGEPQTFERAIPRPEGGGVRHSLAHYLPDVAGGEVRGFYVLVHDVTALHEAAEALREATRAAEAASAAKSEFLANISHEIRTPLNAIIGLSYLFDRTRLTAEQRDFVDNIKIAGRTLLALVNDVLDLAKIESGEAMISAAPLNLEALVREVAAVLAPGARAKGLTLDVEVPAALPTIVLGDGDRVRQILTNLVGNAIKFTERGRVDVRVEIGEETDERVWVRICVADTGIGVDPDAAARIFQPFVQADTSTTRRFGGTGLGLSIVRRLTERMGGGVGLRSVPGEGSEFSVRLPFGLPSAASAGAGAAPTDRAAMSEGLVGVDVLLVDDSDINREIAGHILALAGARVTGCADGREALDHLRAAPRGFDAVLMDVQMPGMDGHEATRRIRGELGLGELPVIGLTAGALSAARQIGIEAGMSDFLIKPVDPKLLVATIERHVRRGREEPTRARSR